MDCLKPLDVFYCGTLTAADGVRSPRVIFSFAEAVKYWQGVLGCDWFVAADKARQNHHLLSCGKCVCCLARKRKDMSVRLAHESRMHEQACFITLTYNDDSIPRAAFCFDRSCPDVVRGAPQGFNSTPTLLPSDVQKFIKRLRRHLEYRPKIKQDGRDHVDKPIRYFCVGEYGTKSRRPHYHLIVFGWKPSDMVFHEERGKGEGRYVISRSAQVEKLWTYGFSTVCEVNVGVAKYCAQYVTKKFARFDEVNSENDWICPEFTLQSVKNGGIGSPWLEKYYQQLRTGFVTVSDGKRVSKCSIPRYYYDRLRKIRLPFWLELRDERLKFILSRSPSVEPDNPNEPLEELLGKRDCIIDTYHFQVTKESI